MLPTFQPRKPFHRRARADASAAPPAVLTVVSVTFVDEYHANWEFSGIVTTDESGPPELAIETRDGTQVPDYCGQMSPTSVQCEYPNGGIEAGQTWNLTGPPSGFDLHGATVAVPEAGVLE